jgi:hypothetical protein
MGRSQFRRGDRLCGTLGLYELCARNSWEPGILAKVWTLGKVERLGIERTSPTELVFLNVYGAQELIPRNEFRQPM